MAEQKEPKYGPSQQHTSVKPCQRGLGAGRGWPVGATQMLGADDIVSIDIVEAESPEQ